MANYDPDKEQRSVLVWAIIAVISIFFTFVFLKTCVPDVDWESMPVLDRIDLKHK